MQAEGATPSRATPAPRTPPASVVWLLGGVAALALAYLFRGLLVPLFLAVALAYLVSPLIAWAEGFQIRRSVAVGGLYLGALVVLAAGLLLGPRLRVEAAALAERLPTLAAAVDAGLQLAGRDLAETFPPARRYLPSAEARRGWIEQFLEGRAGRVTDIVEHAGYAFIVVLLVPFFAFFLLRDTPRMIAFVMDRLPPAHVETSVAVWCEIDRIIGRYIRGVALDGLVIGTLAALGLWVLGVPYPLLLGAFTGLANAIPFVGPLLSATAASLVVLTHAQGLAVVARVALLFLGIKFLDDALIQPLTIGRSVHLHPMLLLGSVVAGNQALGVLGMIVAVPAVTVLQETVRLLLEHRRVLAGEVPRRGEPAAAPDYLC
ncbi:MAG: AI-2E family transporter [Candidatus Rokubacteria bacterium]|nr:AI-2E family transporter [Candidatus Rokubacteria bacterium]